MRELCNSKAKRKNINIDFCIKQSTYGNTLCQPDLTDQIQCECRFSFFYESRLHDRLSQCKCKIDFFPLFEPKGVFSFAFCIVSQPDESSKPKHRKRNSLNRDIAKQMQ